MQQHRYFIAFVSDGRPGNAEITLPRPIRDIRDVHAVARALTTPQLPDLVITGWQRFED
ncbi:hypothetical protein ABZ793_12305 [Micromonospora sp. NPDC047465]|uniref:hypothetical protein n=1 Tax=Micromonospora sp. NPDC047465 TaxID=3154813 RepID=UPI0033E90778